MPSADVNLATQSSPGNTYETGSLVTGQVGGDLVQLVHEDVQGKLGGGWTEPNRLSVLANMMNNAGDVFIGGERGGGGHGGLYHYVSVLVLGQPHQLLLLILDMLRQLLQH